MSANAVFDQINQGSAKLNHVQTADKSAPVIEKDVKIGTNNHGDLLKDIEKGAQLKHNDDVKDRSNPVVDPNTHIKENNQNALLNEIKAKKADA